jgi:hypothetical protein
MVVYVCNPSTVGDCEVEAEGSLVLGQSILHSKTPAAQKRTQEKITILRHLLN